MHPYQGLEPTAFWKTAVSGIEPAEISGLAKPKRLLDPAECIGTAGSCFAQHLVRHLRRKGFTFVDAEPPPGLLPANLHSAYGFGIYSARYGNIYTTGHLRQLIERVYGIRKPTDAIWEREGRYFDAFRPQIEPNGFATKEEVEADVASHLRRVQWLFNNIDVLVFTLGLTEGWRSKRDGSIYPIAPGVQGIGSFDQDRYEFVNFGYPDVLRDLTYSMNTLKRVNRSLRFILTVSPVPLAATCSGDHVLPATVYSKSVLRAVAGQLSATRPDVDYFPSYEIVAAPPFKGIYFEPGMRDIRDEGVAHVMDIFLREFCTGVGLPNEPFEYPEDVEVACEERVLEFYAKAAE